MLQIQPTLSDDARFFIINQLMLRFFILALLIVAGLSFKAFMFGGVLVNDDNPAYKELALATGKPTKHNCDQNWETTECPRVAVITSGCPDSQCGHDQYYNGDGEQLAAESFFKGIGMAPKHFNVQIDNYKQATNIFSKDGYHYYFWAEDVDIFYFNGGDQSRHIRCWLNDDGMPNTVFSQIRRKILNNDAIVVTVSAGTAALSRLIYGGGSSFGQMYFSQSNGLAKNTIASGNGLNDLRNGTGCLQYQENGALMQGLGFVDFAIDTHFDARGRLGRLVPAMTQMSTKLGVGIDEYACLYYKDGVASVMGRNGVFIVDTTYSLTTQSEYFHLKNVKMNYLTAGDSYNFKTKKLSTSKKIISPSISGFSDSNNILSQYQCTRLATRLVDQFGFENFGRTRIPMDVAYPRSTPVFNILFYKDQETVGYKSGSSYTMESIKMDFSAESRS